MYRVEMHYHNKEVSPCSPTPAAESIPLMKEHGIDAAIVTNHYAGYLLEKREDDWQAAMDFYLSGYRAAKEIGDRIGLRVLLGMELRLNSADANEYLVYGVTEQQLRDYPQLYRMSQKEMRELADKLGWFVAQAHPFRPGMTRCNPAYLDGLEICNAAPGHMFHNNNDLSAAFAEKYHLVGISGSDFHAARDVARGGCYFEKPVETIGDVIAALRAGTFTPIFPEEYAKNA